MKTFKIVFYSSEHGELSKMKEFFREADRIQDLVSEPPEEFFNMLTTFFPVHGWAELEDGSSTIYVIFAPRPARLEEVEEGEFLDWLENVQPSDFKDSF